MISWALVAKIVLSPLLIGLVSWIERRYGHALAGLVNGFPMNSALAATFIVLEQGASFAREMTSGMLAGMASVAAFLLGFAIGATTRKWWVALLSGAAFYLPAASVLAFSPLEFGPAAVLACLTLALAARTMPKVGRSRRSQPQRVWHTPLRIVVGTVLVVAISSAASQLGSNFTGLLILFPAVTSVIASFVVYQGGRAAAIRLVRAMAWGSFSFIAFFVVLGTGLTIVPTPVGFLLACFAAIGASAVIWRLTVSRLPPIQFTPKTTNRKSIPS